MKPFHLFPVSYIKAGANGWNKAASIKIPCLSLPCIFE